MSVRIKRIVAAAVFLAACLTPAACAADAWTFDPWWRLPEGVCSYDKEIDALFNFIVILTGVTFVGTEALLVLFIVKYRHREGRKAFYSHGSHKLEMIWTITPAIILIAIALIQARTWSEIKRELPAYDKSEHIQIFAKQFTWYFRYPDKDGKFGNPQKCVCIEKNLVVPVGKPIVVEMTSDDVIHSLFLPFMRLKQDVVPGMMINAWFDAQKTTAQMREDRPRMTLTDPYGKPRMTEWNYPIACSQLCGLNHYQMSGIVTVLKQDEYDAWLKDQRAAFETGTFPDGTEAVQPEIFDKFWQIVTDKDGHESRKYAGTNKRTALKIPKAASAETIEKLEKGGAAATKPAESKVEK